MTIDEAFAAIPIGWRFYTCDASIIGRYSVMLRQVDHIGYVHGIGQTLNDAIEAAIAKAKWHHRGWTIEAAYIGYEATHPDYDCDCDQDGFVGNGLHVHSMTLEAVRAEIDFKEDERG